MLRILGSFIGGMFSSSKMQDVAIDGIKKLGGLDKMDDAEKAKFLLDYIDKTKHQSPMRRFIALLVVGVSTGFSVVWLLAATVGYGFDVKGALSLAQAVYEYSENVLAVPFGLVIGFYFATNIIQKVGK